MPIPRLQRRETIASDTLAKRFIHNTAMAMADWFGLLNVNKPAGWTSRKAVDHVKRLVRPARIGHAGTLDPLADGVLLLCLGPATRLVPYLHELPKSYRAQFLFGRSSPTDDTEVDVELMRDAPHVSRGDIESALPQFEGHIEQVPPAYSAVKLRGQRAYDLARQGKSPVIAPRAVEVHSITLISWRDPLLELEIVCGSGTYIRSIGRDLARELGSLAVMSGLTRTRIGPFTLDDAVPPAEIASVQELTRQLLPPQRALPRLPQLVVDEAAQDRLRRGLCTACPPNVNASADQEVAILDEDHRLLLIAVITVDRELQPRHVYRPKSGRA